MVVFTVSISEALVTFFLPEDLGTYLVVGEGVGAGERGSRAIWAPRKTMLERYRSQSKAGGERARSHPGSVEATDTSVIHTRSGSWGQGMVAAHTLTASPLALPSPGHVVERTAKFRKQKIGLLARTLHSRHQDGLLVFSLLAPKRQGWIWVGFGGGEGRGREARAGVDRGVVGRVRQDRVLPGWAEEGQGGAWKHRGY